MGFFVSPAVIAMDSVPPSDSFSYVDRTYLELNLQANEAVTKTDANPPIPPTKGASPMYQFEPPM